MFTWGTKKVYLKGRLLVQRKIIKVLSYAKMYKFYCDVHIKCTFIVLVSLIRLIYITIPISIWLTFLLSATQVTPTSYFWYHCHYQHKKRKLLTQLLLKYGTHKCTILLNLINTPWISNLPLIQSFVNRPFLVVLIETCPAWITLSLKEISHFHIRLTPLTTGAHEKNNVTPRLSFYWSPSEFRVLLVGSVFMFLFFCCIRIMTLNRGAEAYLQFFLRLTKIIFIRVCLNDMHTCIM